MARKRHSAEQIINKLREAEVDLAQEMSVPEVARKLGVTEQTYYHWRKEYGGLDHRTLGNAEAPMAFAQWIRSRSATERGGDGVFASRAVVHSMSTSSQPVYQQPSLDCVDFGELEAAARKCGGFCLEIGRFSTLNSVLVTQDLQRSPMVAKLSVWMRLSALRSEPPRFRSHLSNSL